MDAASEPTTQPTHLVLEVARSADGRLEGQIRTDTAGRWTGFSGVLELLKVLEELLDEREIL
jgi:hypothetical protein